MTDESPPHKRRIRYAGTHPKQFHEKYKELDPAAHAEELEKVMARGQTPAGMHRSICVEEILGILKPQPGETGLDATLGFGGHARKILPFLMPGGRLFGIDVDPVELPRTEARLRRLGFDPQALVVQRLNFSEISSLLTQVDGGFDVVLADLGVSSMQIDDPARGFSFKVEGPLDLRLDPSLGQSASEFLLSVTRARLRDLLIDHSDEPHAVVLAAALQGQYLQTTTALAALIRITVGASLPARLQTLERETQTKQCLQRTFQALRIEVNNEFGVLDQFLADLPGCLKFGGRVAIMSFHSGEDRRVKKAFQAGERNGTYSSVAPDVIRPSFDEQRANPRSTSTKLRWAIKA